MLVWSLAAARPLISRSAALGLRRAGLWGHFGNESRGPWSAALGLWVGQLASALRAHPPEVSGVGPHSANLGASNQASGERRGCLSQVHRPGAEGGGAPETAAAAESSLISRWVPLIFFFFLRNSSYSSPPGPNVHLAAHTAQPGSLPGILQQTLHPGRGFNRHGPQAGPRDLIVLKHSSYRLIFQCPLSLVSDLHICWNTIGCSICSSDQLGSSLVLRGSGLCSYLSHHHLLNP